MRRGQVADRGVDRLGGAFHALEDPLEHAAVLAEAAPLYPLAASSARMRVSTLVWTGSVLSRTATDHTALLKDSWDN
jgi:hypothetical protein